MSARCRLKTALATAEQTDPGEAAIYTPKDSHKGANALDSETIKAMKDELEQRTQNLVKQMLGQQLDAYSIADDSFWQKFRTGDFQATPEQIAQAQKDVAEEVKEKIEVVPVTHVTDILRAVNVMEGQPLTE